MRLYKTVTVFSTLIAMGGVVAGFVLLDTATNRASADPSEVNVWIALLGVGLILLSGLVYGFSTRFQPAGMRKSKSETDQDEENG